MDRMRQAFDMMKAHWEKTQEKPRDVAEMAIGATFTKKHFKSFQSLLTLAEEANKLTAEEVQTVRDEIGATSAECNEKPLTVRLVALNLYNELLHLRHRASTDSIH